MKNIIIRKLVKYRGEFLTLFLSIIFLVFFYGKLLLEINSVYFGSGGDGLVAYYGALYHLQFDNTYMHFNGMNYPFGEMVLFAGGFQPFLINIIKFISTNIIDISSYTLGIINLLMLFSIPLCSIILYFIFREVSLPPIYAAIISTGISFLSPQIPRFWGHYSLAYTFAVPLTFLLLLRFYKTPKLSISLFISIALFLLSGTHFYYFGMLGAIILFFWGVMIIKNQMYRNIIFFLKHFSIQLILPFLIVQSLSLYYDSFNDRTNNPWGYLHYVSAWEGVFLPIGMPIGNWINHFIQIRHVDWEGIAFVGIVSTVSFFIFFYNFLKKIFQGKRFELLNITDHSLLNVFFWCSILTLLFSFGLPFKIPGLEILLDYLGIIKQMRSVGRFNWIFYYGINIITYYLIYQSLQKSQKGKRIVLLLLSICFLYYDAFNQNNGKEQWFNNKISTLEDKNNILTENKWLNKISKNDYQALIPLPYTHVGSENIWINPETNMHQNFLITSLKTGIPTTAVHLNRTSLSQTYKNVAMVLEPYRPLEFLKDCPNRKPFLLLASLSEINENEKNLVSKSKLIDSTPEFYIYHLDFDELATISDSMGWNAKKQMDSLHLFLKGSFLSSDSTNNFIVNNFDNLKSNNTYRGNGAMKLPINKKNVIFDGEIPHYAKQNIFKISFWIADIRKDLYGRTEFRIDFFDSAGNIYFSDKNIISNYLKAIDGAWALFEQQFAIDKPTRIKVTLKNHIPFGENIFIDELLIKPISTQLFKTSEREIYKNNRYYSLNKF